jgi:uncharacterized protein YcfL
MKKALLIFLSLDLVAACANNHAGKTVARQTHQLRNSRR